MSDTDKLFAIKETELRDILTILAELPYKSVHIPMLILEQLPIIQDGVTSIPEDTPRQLIEE